MASGDVMASNVEEEKEKETPLASLLPLATSKQLDEFTVVKRKRKASVLDSMDQDESEAKRPNFPPLSGQALTSVSNVI